MNHQKWAIGIDLTMQAQNDIFSDTIETLKGFLPCAHERDQLFFVARWIDLNIEHKWIIDINEFYSYRNIISYYGKSGKDIVTYILYWFMKMNSCK